jgi:hypothetical protein
LNIITPLARLGLYAGNDDAATTAGIVSHQKIPRPATPARTAKRRSRFNIRQSVIARFDMASSMNVISAGCFNQISAAKRCFGNKSENPLF